MFTSVTTFVKYHCCKSGCFALKSREIQDLWECGGFVLGTGELEGLLSVGSVHSAEQIPASPFPAPVSAYFFLNLTQYPVTSEKFHSTKQSSNEAYK